MSKYKIFEDAKFYVPSRYRVEKILGKGSYGVVCLAIDTKAAEDAPVWLAVKKVGGILHKEVLLKRAVRELRMMRFFRGHRNVCEQKIQIKRRR